MRAIYAVTDVRAAEASLMADLPEGELMRRAAFGLATHCLHIAREQTGGVVGRHCTLLVGSGGNGGDALWAGAFLARRGMRVSAVLLSDRVDEAGRAALVASGGRILTVAGLGAGAVAGDAPALLDDIAAADLIIDGMTGIGGSGPLRPQAALLAHAAAMSTATIVAVDIPSGVDADTGIVADPHRAVCADVTVTFGCLKPGHVVAPGRAQVGQLHLVDIGLGLDAHRPLLMALDDVDLARDPVHWNEHKYSRGVVGIIAGSPAYPGAAVLAVGAARRGGCGMVRVVDRGDRVRAAVVAAYPDVVVVDGLGDVRTTGWLCGPGLGTDPQAEGLVAEVLTSTHPVVLDADALRLLADSASLQAQLLDRARISSVTVLLPHDGEFALLGRGRDWPTDAEAGRLAVTRQAAVDLGAIIVRKGPGTLIAGPHGMAYVDDRGPADLATAGSGDVLAGLVAGFLAAEASPVTAGRASASAGVAADPVRTVAVAVGWHARAARRATRHHDGMTAADLLEHLDRGHDVTIGGTREAPHAADAADAADADVTRVTDVSGVSP